MTYVLLVIVLMQSGGYSLYKVGEYLGMDKCFTEREVFVAQMGRPIINYQAICVVKDVDSTNI